jgi:hypothetical protein
LYVSLYIYSLIRDPDPPNLVLFLALKYEALAWLCGGLSFFGLVGLLAVWNDKASKIPYVSSTASYPLHHFLQTSLPTCQNFENREAYNWPWSRIIEFVIDILKLV